MQFLSTMLISLACLSLRGEAALLKERSRASSAVTLLLRSQGPGKVDTKTLVASLGEVAKGLQAEDKKAIDLLQESKSSCKKTDLELNMAVNKGRRAYDMATDDYDKTSAQVNALKASLSELQGQISSSSKELDSLQGKLKKMRQDKGLLKKGASSALRQVESVIAKTVLRESEEHNRGPSSLQKKVSSLEELSKSLSFLQRESDEEEGSSDDKHEDAEEPEQKKNQKHAPVMILKADKQAVVKASEATQRGFNEEEKKIIDLIEVERKKLEDLEDNLQDLQPAISNKLKQAMEINRTLAAASRGMKRDSALMAIEKKKCTAVADNIGAQRKQRSQVINDVSMASKVLEHMDTLLFLSKDLQGLRRVAPTFLQLDDHGLPDFAKAGFMARSAPLALLQEGESMGIEDMVENYGSSVMDGPFDSVTKMISGLVASLKAQANEEVNQHQFCQDSLAKNRRDRIAKKNSMDTLTSTIRWSKMAIVRLDDDKKYLEKEINRLKTAQSAESTELKAETDRVNKELAEHKLADEVITKSVVILDQLCDLSAASASVLQQGSSSSSASQAALLQKQRKSTKVGSRFSQCKEASNLLKSASKGVKALDKITKDYLSTYTTLSGTIKSDAKSAQEARETELKSTNAARAERASELATATKDVKEAEKELKLIDDSKKELEHSCSHVETREEKMAKRKEEIDALKEALNVLNGESIPA
jgi:hypothetical protein